MKYKLRHKTVYTYDEAVDNYQSVLCLQPRNLLHQKCHSFELELTPQPTKTYAREDFFGNTLNYFSLHEPHLKFEVVANSVVEVFPINTPTVSEKTCAEVRELFLNDRNLKVQLLQFQLPSYYIAWDEEIKEYASSCFLPNASFYSSVKNLSEKIFKEFQFKSGFTTVNTPLKTVLKEKKGVCQDFSHLAIACLRSLGFAARYVSGYLETLPPKGKPKLQGSDASHAWISVYIPDMGWCEFDPTNNLIPQQRHIVTAYGRDYADVAPLKGIVFSFGSHKVKVEVDVIPI
jgi:transglutaminase-like putative cysteine protease